MEVTAITKTKGSLSDDKFRSLYWNETAQDLLLGGKIIKVEYMSSSEANDIGWYNRPISILVEKNGNQFWITPSRDDEGNDGGALFASDSKISILPVLDVKEKNNNCNCGDGNGVLPQHCDCEEGEK